jgi:hypothetical protein
VPYPVVLLPGGNKQGVSGSVGQQQVRDKHLVSETKQQPSFSVTQHRQHTSYKIKSVGLWQITKDSFFYLIY